MWKSKIAAFFLLVSCLLAEISGYLKTHGFFFSFPYNEKELIELIRFRLRWEKDWGNFSFKVHYEFNAIAGSQNYFSLLTGTYQDEFKVYHLYESDDSAVFHYLDRFSLSYSSDRLFFQLGRQRIPWGKARVFSALDLVNPYNPFALEKEERQGVNAARIQLYLSGFSWIEGVYARRENEDRYGIAFFFTLGNFDFTVITAREGSQRRVFGAAIEGSVAGAGVRAELALRRTEEEDFYDYSLGGDYQVSSKLYVLTEYFYTEGSWIFPEGKILTVVADYQLSSLVRVQLSCFHSSPGAGNFFLIRLLYSAEENFDLVFGFMYSSGGEGFWQLPKILYSGYSIYF